MGTGGIMGLRQCEASRHKDCHLSVEIDGG